MNMSLTKWVASWVFCVCVNISLYQIMILNIKMLDHNDVAILQTAIAVLIFWIIFKAMPRQKLYAQWIEQHILATNAGKWLS